MRAEDNEGMVGEPGVKKITLQMDDFKQGHSLFRALKVPVRPWGNDWNKFTPPSEESGSKDYVTFDLNVKKATGWGSKNDSTESVSLKFKRMDGREYSTRPELS